MPILFTTACETTVSGTEKHTVAVPMRDSVLLATDLYFPHGSQRPYPAILIRTPYNKNWLAEYGHYYTQSGYVVAIQDVRGRWASEGRWEPFVHEGHDGYDAVEWLAKRDWSSGKVGMVGGSYSGTAQLQAAFEKPPHLVTIVPNVTPAMPFDNIPLDGGAFALGWAVRWTDIVENANTGQLLQAKLQQGIAADWSEPLSGLPVIDLDRSVVGHEVSYFRDWVRHPPGDAYWRSFSSVSALQDLEIPVFLQSGWFDPGTRGSRLAFEHMVNGGNRQVRLILGPWAHGDRGTRYLNGVDMGAAAKRDLMDEYRKWFDFWLKTDKRDGPDAPGVEAYIMGSNRWVNGAIFPPGPTQYHRLYLSTSTDGHGRLVWELPQDTGQFDTFTYNPARPTPSFYAAMKRGGLDEYHSRVSKADDVLAYESEPLDRPIDIVGPIQTKLYASSSARDTDWTATLYTLTSTGEVRVLGLTFGILRARYRDGMAQASLLEPGRVYPFTIDMNHTAVTVNKGERLRLEIASAAFPEFSRNLNTGGANELETEWVEAQQRVYRGGQRASYLRLPLLETPAQEILDGKGDN